MAPPSENRRALRSHPCVALSSRSPAKYLIVYTISFDWTILAMTIVLDMGSTIRVFPHTSEAKRTRSAAQRKLSV